MAVILVNRIGWIRIFTKIKKHSKLHEKVDKVESCRVVMGNGLKMTHPKLHEISIYSCTGDLCFWLQNSAVRPIPNIGFSSIVNGIKCKDFPTIVARNFERLYLCGISYGKKIEEP